MAKKKIKDDELLSRSKGIFQGSVNWRQTGLEDRWRKSNDLYNGVFSSTEKKTSDVLIGQGRLFIPKTYNTIQRILVDVLDDVFFDPDEIVSVANWKNIPTDTRETVKTLLNYRLNGNPINFYFETYEAVIDGMKNKVGIFKVYPELKTEKAQKPIEIDPYTGEVLATEEYEKIVSFRPKLECTPYEDVFFDRQATWKDYWKYPIVHRFRRSLDYLKRRGYKNLDKINPDDDIEANDAIKSQREYQSPFSNNVEEKGQRGVWCYEIWDFMDVNGDGLLESCSYVCVGDASGPSLIVRGVEENTLPYRLPDDDYNRPPFVVGQAFPEPHQMYGKDMPEITEALQKETNSLRNQRREAVALSLRKPILANRSAGIDLVSLTNRRIGGVVLGDDISESSVREMQISDPTQTNIQEQSTTNNDYYETTSIPPNLMGMPSSGDETATAVTNHVANANKKINHIIRNFRYTLFLPAFRMLLRLEQEYETDEFIMLVTGRKLGWEWAADSVPASEVIQGEFELVVNMGVQKQVQINKYLLLLDRGTQANSATAQMVQMGVIKPEEAKFFNVTKPQEQILKILGEKELAEWYWQAQPPQAPQENQIKGLASQAAMTGGLDAEVTNMNPEGVMLGA